MNYYREYENIVVWEECTGQISIFELLENDPIK